MIDLVGRYVLNVGLAGVEFLYFFLVGIESRDSVTYICESQRQWKAHVAATDNADSKVLPRKKLRLAIHGHPVSSLGKQSRRGCSVKEPQIKCKTL
jgi:hypothetical protein